MGAMTIGMIFLFWILGVLLFKGFAALDISLFLNTLKLTLARDLTILTQIFLWIISLNFELSSIKGEISEKILIQDS
jgi:hypothetical protein